MKRARLDDAAKGRALTQPADLTDRVSETAESTESEGKRRNVYMTDDLLRRARLAGRRKHLSVSAILRLALEDFLGKEGL